MAQVPKIERGGQTWIQQEGAAADFYDARLRRRFQEILKRIAVAGEPSIPFACQDAAQAKAAYRFFSNPHVNEHAILSAQSCLTDYLICLARLGGNLARAHDPPPGNIVIWQGMRRLDDLVLGAELFKRCW